MFVIFTIYLIQIVISVGSPFVFFGTCIANVFE